MEDDYKRYRGKCKEYCLELIKTNPELTLVRGFYHCPFWGKQQHWWCKDNGGVIYDPTVRQFPSKGVGAEYEEFNGIIQCDECGKSETEDRSQSYGKYIFCSVGCMARHFGVQ